MAVRGHHLLAALVLLALAASAAASGGRHHGHRGKAAVRSRARLELVPAAPHASLADRAIDDRHRRAYIAAKLRRRPRAEVVGASAFAMPLTSGAYTGTGQYFVRFRVGTPAQPFVLVADTGSDLTWVKCRRGQAAGDGGDDDDGSSSSSPPPPARVFRPADSKTWAPIPCASDTCTSYVPFSLANCSSATSPCAYDYRSVVLGRQTQSARGILIDLLRSADVLELVISLCAWSFGAVPRADPSKDCSHRWPAGPIWRKNVRTGVLEAVRYVSGWASIRYSQCTGHSSVIRRCARERIEYASPPPRKKEELRKAHVEEEEGGGEGDSSELEEKAVLAAWPAPRYGGRRGGGGQIWSGKLEE
ncbi:hypothetical protein PR202_gb02071 [Eleusine coracana subsp. coracana]|uniref:Peptidase A1 domain-containing protein n=1 Tax=Eleusine coracana subsp. coracana TaxID=191504 RepID=A0AAV5DYD4_ELECO|nr:hypothetical protein PR202_gb02071 [Eleusine coracana subsp. coracana]